MGSTDLALSWKDHHGVLFNVFEHLLAKKSLVDCTLAAEGKFLKAHRIVLSACSPYFEALFDQEYDKHPIIFLRDVQFEDLKTLLEFVYSGEIKIPESRLVEFLNVAEALQIKGLGGAGNDGQGSTKKTCFEALRQRETSSPVPRKRSRRPSNSSDSNSRDRAEIIPINSETSRLQSSGESQVPVASSSSVPQPAPPAKQTVPSEEISVDVTKVKEEVEHTSQSACSEQVSSDPDQAEGNEEILGLKPEFAQVTFTEDYSDDMMPEDSDSVKPVMDQDQPCSSRQYPGFSTEPVNPGELGMHGSYGVGGADQPVPEGLAALPHRTPWHIIQGPAPDLAAAATAAAEESRSDKGPCVSWSWAGAEAEAEAEAEAQERRKRRRPSVKAHCCALCRKQFMYPTQLVRHMRVHTGEKPFECEVCRLTFTESGNLQKHMRVHTDERPFQCPYCFKTFRQKAHLQGHVVIHTGERPYTCRDCGRSFIHTRNLRHHRQTHHPSPDSPYDPKLEPSGDSGFDP